MIGIGEIVIIIIIITYDAIEGGAGISAWVLYRLIVLGQIDPRPLYLRGHIWD